MISKEQISKKVDEYICICKGFCASVDDYTNKNVKANNTTSAELLDFVTNLHDDPLLAKHVFEILLDNKDISVLSSAASYCLKFNFHIKRAEKVLKKISKGNDPIAAFGAEMTLMVWRGEIPGKSL